MKGPIAVAAALLLAAGNTALADTLLEAVRADDKQEVARLIEARADVNAADPLGTTPLMWAARYGDAVLVARLIRAGANAAAENTFGVTPMSEAALIGSAPVIRELLAAGVDPNSPNPEGETPLMLVVRTGQLDAAEVLIDAGADVNAKRTLGGSDGLDVGRRAVAAGDGEATAGEWRGGRRALDRARMDTQGQQRASAQGTGPGRPHAAHVRGANRLHRMRRAVARCRRRHPPDRSLWRHAVGRG